MEQFTDKIKQYAPAFIAGLLGGIFGGILVFSSFEPAEVPTDSSGEPIEQQVTVEENSAVIDVVNQVSPSVVSISASSTVQGIFGQVLQQRQGGTGFLVSNDGLIATNKHVVQDQSRVQVTTEEGEIFDGEVVATDPLNDLALVKIEANDMPAVEFGDEESLQVGQRVVAIGNALGQFRNTVTAGVVSGIGRVITASDGSGQTETIENVIQTDASINPGNSGGPLVNISGQVIGINTAMSRQGQEFGFAIPINVAETALESYRSNGSIVRPFLGVRYVNISKELAGRENLPVEEGAIIVQGEGTDRFAVSPGGPADQAGLEARDIITHVSGERITRSKGLVTLLQEHQPGDTITLTYLRDGQERETQVTLDSIGE